MAEEKKRDGSYSHILKYTGIFSGVQGLNILMSVVRNKLVAVILGPGGMGLLSLFNSSVNLMSSTAGLGIQTSGVKVLAEKLGDNQVGLAEAMSQVRSYCLLSAVMGLFLTVLLGPLLDSLSFTWGDHTLHYILLAPTVFFTILAGGEIAILKATRELKALAFSSFFMAVLTLLTSVPVYWYMGVRGILLALFMLALGQWAVYFRFSVRKYPYRVSFSGASLRNGLPMLRLGGTFVVVGLMNSGTDFLLRSFLNTRGGLDVVGLFNAGVTIVLVYADMVFSVMGSDYFPRLSSIRAKGSALSLCVNRQLEMNVLLMGPIIMAIIVALPVAVPLLFNTEFMGMLVMTQAAALSMVFKAIYLPIEYLPLSRGDSGWYLAQETVAVALLVSGEVLGYMLGGLTGLGCGIAVAYAVETAGVLAFSRFRYGYRLSPLGRRYAVFQLACGAALMWVVVANDYRAVIYWIAGGMVVAASSLFSFSRLRKVIGK